MKDVSARFEIREQEERAAWARLDQCPGCVEPSIGEQGHHVIAERENIARKVGDSLRDDAIGFVVAIRGRQRTRQVIPEHWDIGVLGGQGVQFMQMGSGPRIHVLGDRLNSLKVTLGQGVHSRVGERLLRDGGTHHPHAHGRCPVTDLLTGCLCDRMIARRVERGHAAQ